ncbi:unnamed protein product, partial [Oncorhynchus mykiss]
QPPVNLAHHICTVWICVLHMCLTITTRGSVVECDIDKLDRGEVERQREAERGKKGEEVSDRLPVVFSELSTEEEEEGDDEQGSTDEFSDSIEDDEDKLTAKSLASTKNSGMACGQGVLSGGPVSGALSQGGMGQVKHLAEQKRAIEEELEEMRTQLETTGYSSLAQMRSTLLRLQQENEALKENQGEVEGLGELEDPTDTCQENEALKITKGGRRSRRAGRSNRHVPRERGLKENQGEVEGLGELEDPTDTCQGWEQKEEEEMEEEEEVLPAVGPTHSKRGPPAVRMREGRGKRQCTRPHSLDLGTLLSHRQPDHTEKVKVQSSTQNQCLPE